VNWIPRSRLRCAGFAPELRRCDPGALYHRSEFGPHDLGVDSGLPSAESAEAAVRGRDHVLSPYQLRVAHYSFGYQLGMLDERRDGVHHARDQDLTGGKFHVFKYAPFKKSRDENSKDTLTLFLFVWGSKIFDRLQ